MKTRAATRLTTRASTFLVALCRWRLSTTPMPRMAISSTPWAAPKYPPYTPATSTAGHTQAAPWSGRPPRASARATTQAWMRGPSTTSSTPSATRAGTIVSKASLGSTSSRTAPSTEPSKDADASRTSRGR